LRYFCALGDGDDHGGREIGGHDDGLESGGHDGGRDVDDRGYDCLLHPCENENDLAYDHDDRVNVSLNDRGYKIALVRVLLHSRATPSP